MVNEVAVLPAIPECPDSPFIEDTTVVFGGRALLTHMGAPSRRPEVAGIAPVLRGHGIDVRAMAGANEWAGVETSQLVGLGVEKEATLDGGDVLAVDTALFVGLSDRTNEAGASLLAEAFPGVPVWGVPLSLWQEGPGTPALHLKSVVSWARPSHLLAPKSEVMHDLAQAIASTAAGQPDSRVLALHSPDTEIVPLEAHIIPTPDVAACNVVSLGAGVLHRSAEEFPSSKGVWPQLGPTTMGIDMSEMAKADGALTCCSVLVP